jgi:two-component system LytT family response regulator
MSDNPSTQIVNCIIADDEEASVREMQRLLRNHRQFNLLASCSNANKAIEIILQQKPDLVFLDIQMPGKTGFEIVEALQSTNVKPFIIFITAFDRFAIQAIKASAFDYLLKPIDPAELALSLERFLAHFDKREKEISYTTLLQQAIKKKIRFNTTGGFILVDPQDIVYIQADWNYSEIHYSREKYELVAMNLGRVEEILPQGMFARINRSVIINLSFLEKVQRSKRLCYLRKEDVVYEFRIPLLKIRNLE